LGQVRADALRYFAEREQVGGGSPTRLLRHRPATVEAKQVLVGYENEVAEWSGGVAVYGRGVVVWTDTGDLTHAGYGDWVVRGPFGDFYPVPDRVIFSQYEGVIPVVSE
jgi:hypothetical protein